MIDWERVSTLREEVGADDFQEVIDLFLEEVDEVVSRLHDHPVQKDLEEDMHFLKGSALSLGFKSFAAMCQLGENAARDGQYHAIDLPALFQTYQSSRTNFLENLNGNASA